MITDEILFYGGLLLTIAAAVSLMVSIVVCTVRQKKLDVQMDSEYGPKQKR